MKIRLAALAGLTAVGMLSGASGAADATCNLLQDDKGDAALVGPEGSDSSLDIVSADIASDAKNLTGAIRLAAFSGTNPRALGGQNFYLTFTAPGNSNPLWVSAEVDASGAAAFAFGEYTVDAAGTGTYTDLGVGEGVVDTEKSEIRVTAPVSGWAGKGDVKPGASLKSLTATATARVGAPVGPGVVFTIDEAVGTKSYTAGAASCVTPGK